MKKIISACLMAAIVLAGCSSSATTTTICTLEQEGLSGTVTLEAKGDKVTKQTESVLIPTNGATPEDIEKTKSTLEQMYGGLEGVTMNFEEKDGKFLLETVIDYSKADLAKLSESGLIEAEGKVAYISLKETIAFQEQSGLKCELK